MISKIFCIYDSKAEAYNAPFYSQATGAAIRSFATEANNPESFIHKYPADYTLFELGSFDDSTASFTLEPTPKSLGTALEYISRGQAA